VPLPAVVPRPGCRRSPAVAAARRSAGHLLRPPAAHSTARACRDAPAVRPRAPAELRQARRLAVAQPAARCSVPGPWRSARAARRSPAEEPALPPPPLAFVPEDATGRPARSAPATHRAHPTCAPGPTSERSAARRPARVHRFGRNAAQGHRGRRAASTDYASRRLDASSPPPAAGNWRCADQTCNSRAPARCRGRPG
jgi:hypothetical protein